MKRAARQRGPGEVTGVPLLPRPSRAAEDSLELWTPHDLEASTFRSGDHEYAVLSFCVPQLQLPPGLTAAEQRVARGVLEGQSNQEIALAHGVSSRTVANQLQSVYAKLQIGSRRELARRCGPAGSATARKS